MNYINAYTVEVMDHNDELVTVDLRLDIRGQMALQKKFDNETTGETLSGAMSDVNKFVNVLTQALNFAGNHNKISKGEDLADLLIVNDKMGMMAKSTLLNNIARVSGIYDEKEFEAVERNIAKRMNSLFDGENDETKNS